MPKRPNLVVFLPDQQRADTVTPSIAPNLAKLAEESTVFERAFVTQPVCTPSRSSIMTGTWPHQNGCTHNSVALPRHLKCLPQLVEGYKAAYFGKCHLGRESEAQRGFHHWISTEGLSDYSRFLVSQGYQPDCIDDSFSAHFVSGLPEEISKPHFLAEHARRFIHENRHRPFILFVAFVEPHSPYHGPLDHAHPLSEIKLDPTAALEPPDDWPLRYRLMREWQRNEAILDRERLPQQLYFGATNEEYISLKQRYLGLVTLIDRSIGAVLAELQSCQSLDHTIVAHTSDHGDMLGTHQLFGKEVMFEEAVRVPLLLRLPGQLPRRIADPVSLIDFLPTLIELLGGQAAFQCAGKSLAPLLRGEANRRESVVIEWAPNRTKVKKGTTLASRGAIKRAINESTRALVTSEGWKFCWRNGDRSELYDLQNDSQETVNLVHDVRYRENISHCAQEIREWQKNLGDRLRLGKI